VKRLCAAEKIENSKKNKIKQTDVFLIKKTLAIKPKLRALILPLGNLI